MDATGSISTTAVPEAEAGQSLWRDAWLRLRKNRMAVLGGIFILVLALASFSAPLIPQLSYSAQDLHLGATPPSAAHWLGTDDLGRDLLARLLYGGRISLEVGLAATTVSVVIGVLYGTLSGYFGGRLDMLLMRFVDILYSLPYVIFVILLMVIVGRNIILLFMAIGAVEWLDMARIVRGQVQSLKHQEFIEAAQALGL
ncbi:MAG TPA: ABC transporter permease subunit, partial [Dongiaceae bacterium]|nr:ABC transporter permease subunit [Dongiaceae bacterium]